MSLSIQKKFVKTQNRPINLARFTERDCASFCHTKNEMHTSNYFITKPTKSNLFQNKDNYLFNFMEIG